MNLKTDIFVQSRLPTNIYLFYHALLKSKYVKTLQGYIKFRLLMVGSITQPVSDAIRFAMALA